MGNKKDLEKSIEFLAQNSSNSAYAINAHRLYEASVVCLKAGFDDEARKFLEEARASLSPQDFEYKTKIGDALAHPEKFYDDDDR